MRMLLAALAFTVIGLAAGAEPSYAEITYPWCAQYARDGRNCGFSTWEQCRATVSGTGGFCVENPMYQPGIPPASRRPRRSG